MPNTQISPDELEFEAGVHDRMADFDDTAGRLVMAEANRTRAEALRRRAALAREVTQWVEARRARECGHEQCRDNDGMYGPCVVRDS